MESVTITPPAPARGKDPSGLELGGGCFREHRPDRGKQASKARLT